MRCLIGIDQRPKDPDPCPYDEIRGPRPETRVVAHTGDTFAVDFEEVGRNVWDLEQGPYEGLIQVTISEDNRILDIELIEVIAWMMGMPRSCPPQQTAEDVGGGGVVYSTGFETACSDIPAHLIDKGDG
jgi:hypothetical protein